MTWTESEIYELLGTARSGELRSMGGRSRLSWPASKSCWRRLRPEGKAGERRAAGAAGRTEAESVADLRWRRCSVRLESHCGASLGVERERVVSGRSPRWWPSVFFASGLLGLARRHRQGAAWVMGRVENSSLSRSEQNVFKVAFRFCSAVVHWLRSLSTSRGSPLRGSRPCRTAPAA